jgi:hypothetical protein
VPKLPELRRAEVLRLVRDHAGDWEQQGDLVTGVSKDGHSFTIHMVHGGGLRPDQLSRALKYMDVSRAEFEEWLSRV